MWLRITAYNNFNIRKIRKLYDYLSKTKYSKENREKFIEVWSGNIPDGVPVARFWREKLSLRLSKPIKGKKPTRYAYQFVVNPGVKLEYEEDFKKFLRDFLNECFFDKHYFVFIHRDKNCIHAHILVHAVDQRGNMLRITKKEVSEFQTVARKLEEKHNLKEKLRKSALTSTQSLKEHEKVNHEDLINENWGVRNIIAHSKLFSRSNKRITTTTN